ncbi:MAG: ATP-binding protein [Candidatus Rokuibacteriota bacterium]
MRRQHVLSAVPVAPAMLGPAERILRFLLRRSPLGALVRSVARIHASVHTKLLAAFLLIAFLFILTGAVSLRIVTGMSRQSQLLDEAHTRVDASRRIEHALAMQMNFTAMALLLKDEATIASILRENNRFNDTLARIEAAAPPDERELIQRIRAAQDEVLTTVADIVNLIRDGKVDEAMALQLSSGYPLYQRIQGLVSQVVKAEEGEMGRLRSSVAAAHRRAVLLAGTFAGASIVLALLLGFVISWSFILPVRQAHGFLSQVAKGNFGATIEVPNRDEFGDLATRMNAMSQELARLSDDQRRASQQLRTLNEQLARASKAKSDFLASMSHELRTPLNAVLGFTEMMLDDVYGDVPRQLREPISDIQACGKQLLRLINDVLDLSKIEAGRMELSLGEYSVEDVVNTVRFSLRSLAAEKGLEFVAATQPDMPLAFGDAQRITQCLMNLAGNALKFTAQGRVEIWVERQAETLLYRVSDTGIGIPPDQVGQIFEEFRQVDPTITREFGGTGLGLSITKKFVELHGGRIWVESEAGKGSAFFFAIPLRADGSAAA